MATLVMTLDANALRCLAKDIRAISAELRGPVAITFDNSPNSITVGSVKKHR